MNEARPNSTFYLFPFGYEVLVSIALIQTIFVQL